MRRKYQVFVSSTYSDLRSERQACVEAILKAGHIPAGMELFSAGNERQLEIIKRWIDESDIYMLLLGGRYGSVEPESGMSYTEIEYRYALEQNKTMFSIVMSDDYLDAKVREEGKGVLELNRPEQYNRFKNLVLSKISTIFNSKSDIQIMMLQSLIDIQSRISLRGWVKAEEQVRNINTIAIPDQLTAEITGKWRGTYDQVLWGKERTIEITMLLAASKSGRITGIAEILLPEKPFSVTLDGGLYSRNFIKLEYENVNKAIVQFGSFVLGLSADANKISGQFVGYGHINQSIVSGPIQMNKIVAQN